MNKEVLWLERLRKYLQERPSENYACSWWLRLEYNSETPTAQINYWLNKSVDRGILGKEARSNYTKYWFLGKDLKDEH